MTTVGVLSPGKTMTVLVGQTVLNAYQPAAGQPRDVFTVAATAIGRGTPPPPPGSRASAGGITIAAPNALASLLVRVPDGVTLVVRSAHGDVNVTDITGNARVVAQAGNVTLMLPGYAQAAVGDGNLRVTMGALQWPGTLHFSARNGDVELRISAKAAFGVHMHTGDGVLFTDFGLVGTSSGRAETIDGSVNGGGPNRIDVESARGGIRLLRLQPQA